QSRKVWTDDRSGCSHIRVRAEAGAVRGADAVTVRSRSRQAGIAEGECGRTSCLCEVARCVGTVEARAMLDEVTGDGSADLRCGRPGKIELSATGGCGCKVRGSGERRCCRYG